MLGCDTVFFTGDNDSEMVAKALAEDRVILTRDTQLMKRQVITSGQIKAILFRTDDPEKQMRQVIETLQLDESHPFTRCLECNVALEERTREQMKDRVPPYVFRTQEQYMECPSCHRVYWRGTHWQAMTKTLIKFAKG